MPDLLGRSGTPSLVRRNDHPGHFIAEVVRWHCGIDVEAWADGLEWPAKSNVHDVIATLDFDQHPTGVVIDGSDDVDVETAGLAVSTEVQAGRNRLDEVHPVTLWVEDELGRRVRLV